MSIGSSRRSFLAASLAVPAVGLSSMTSRSLAPFLSGKTEPFPQAEGGLQYRMLGKTGMKVTAVGFGCMITSDPAVIERAADLGINYFDTARGYQGGNNERMVGAALKKKRKDLIISSKTGGETKQAALDHLDRSLLELDTDYLDIWYLHGKGKPEDVLDELVEAQRIAKQAGKIRFTGVSTHRGQAELIPALVKAGQMDVILTSYNFAMDPSMTELVNSARQADIGIVAMKVMAGGYRRVRPGDKLYETMRREGAMLAALKWVLKNPNVDTTIPSITDMDQLDEDMKGMREPFTENDQKILSVQLEYIRPLYCRMCGRCEGRCPQGLPVADILRYLTYSDGYGQFALGREHFLSLPKQVLQARCDQCPSCVVECPSGVNVAARLARAQELFA